MFIKLPHIYNQNHPIFEKKKNTPSFFKKNYKKRVSYFHCTRKARVTRIFSLSLSLSLFIFYFNFNIDETLICTYYEIIIFCYFYVELHLLFMDIYIFFILDFDSKTNHSLSQSHNRIVIYLSNSEAFKKGKKTHRERKEREEERERKMTRGKQKIEV